MQEVGSPAAAEINSSRAWRRTSTIFRLISDKNTKQGPKVALLSPLQNKEPPLRGGVHLKTVAIVEPAKGKRGTSAG